MLLATTMMLSATTMLNDFTLDGRDGKWLVHLTPGSVKQLISRDSIPRRINLEAGYDLYKDKTWEELRALRRLRRPRRIWFSFPCTYWCPWSSLNYASPERKEILEAHRRRERFINETLEEDPDCLFYWEWPHPCFGWSQRPLRAVEKAFTDRGQDWDSCRIDGFEILMVNS